MITFDNQPGVLRAAISAMLTAGNYFLRVKRAGKPPQSSFDLSYTEYGSLGRYSISTIGELTEDQYEENDTPLTAADPLGDGDVDLFDTILLRGRDA